MIVPEEEEAPVAKTTKKTKAKEQQAPVPKPQAKPTKANAEATPARHPVRPHPTPSLRGFYIESAELAQLPFSVAANHLYRL
jgi:hypothetical protein